MNSPLSAFQPSAPLDPLRLLSALQGQPRWAWVTDDETLVAWGQSAALHAGHWTGLEEQLQDLRKTRPLPEDVYLFGSLPFDSSRAADNLWACFRAPTLILPQAVYRQTPHGQQFLSLTNEPAPPQKDLSQRQTPPARWNDDMSFEQWNAMLQTAQRQMRNGALKKVVLARSRSVWFETQPDLTVVFSALVKKYPGAFRFYFEPEPGCVFMGATPELLAKTQGDRLETTALAGSAPRGRTSEEDEQMGLDLLNSAKDRREQQIVVESILNDLRALGAELDVPPAPQLRRLPNIQHLETPIRARLPHAGILPAAAALHPTPALAGEPRAQALAFIREQEPVARGCYGAPIGWMKPNGDGLFAVAIRSAIFYQQRGTLYAGAGMLPDSDPEKEWRETALKFRPMMEALGMAEAA